MLKTFQRNCRNWLLSNHFAPPATFQTLTAKLHKEFWLNSILNSAKSSFLFCFRSFVWFWLPVACGASTLKTVLSTWVDGGVSGILRKKSLAWNFPRLAFLRNQRTLNANRDQIILTFLALARWLKFPLRKVKLLINVCWIFLHNHKAVKERLPSNV